jgi:Xaa-Pro aminopeptidase
MRKAAEFADLALEKAMSFVEPGIKEVKIANIIMETLLDVGSEGIAFDTIVGTGSNAAIPHHTAGDTVVREKDHVVIDMGAVYKGYRSDITRTVKASDSKDSKFDEIYGIVLEAQLCAIEASEPGIPANSLDAIARDVIIGYGYGQYFSHGLGHGVGLDVHEKPMLVKSSVDTIDIGSVFTVEPGIYIPGWGGVRIEDMVLMEESGPVVLTKTPK